MKSVKKILVLFLTAIMFVVSDMNLGLSNGTYVAQAASISISKSSFSLTVGNSYTLSLTGTSKLGKWSSANKKIATVDSKGKVTALKAGKTEIYVQHNNKKYTCKVTVKDAVINYKSMSLDVDETVDLQLKGINSKIKWSSQNSAIASVNSKGEVTANAPGKVNIKASVGNSTYVCKVTVNNIEVNEIYIDLPEYSLSKGETAKLDITIYPEDATVKTVTFKSSDENITKVDKHGVITAINEGIATIYATSDNGVTDALTIEIIAQPTLSVRNTTLQLGESKEEIIHKLGQPSSIGKSNYGDETYIYSDDYSKLLFLYLQGDKLVGVYTNSIDYDFNGINKKTFGETDTIYSTKYRCRYFVDATGDNSVNALLLIDSSVDLNSYTDEILSNMEKEIFHITNAYRVQAGLTQLIWSKAANISAKEHSLDMAEKNYFSHYSLSGDSPFDRMEREGINYSSAGENINVGYATSLEASHGWYQSPGHRSNILETSYTYLGVGCKTGGGYGVYYTQNFYRE